MGDLKSGESFTDRVYVQYRSNGLPATGLTMTCTIINELGQRSNGSVTEVGFGWYACTFTPDAEGVWATEWKLGTNYLVWIPFKIFKIGGGLLADVYNDVQNLITLINTIDEVVDAISEAQSDFQSVLSNIYTELQTVGKHIHNYERWLGSTSGVAPADEDSFDPFIATTSATAEEFGTPIAVLDGTDTPVQSNMNYFDLHRLLITDISVADEVFKIRIADNGSGATSWSEAVAAGHYTDILIQVTSISEFISPIQLKQNRLAKASKIWVAIAKEGAGSGTISFFIGLHEYIA